MKKNILYTFAAIFLMLACTSKPEAENNTKIDKVAVNAYLKDAVGIQENGELRVINPETIKKHWNDKLKSENIDGVLSEVEIAKATPADTVAAFYIIVAKSEDKKTKVTAFLTLKEDKFYFEIQDKALSLSICQGCIDGCNPGVSLHEGVKSIVCSPCIECMKGSIEIY